MVQTCVRHRRREESRQAFSRFARRLSALDGGKWTAPAEVANGVQTAAADGKVVRYPTCNPVLFQPATGPLMLFFKAGPSPSWWCGTLTTSADDGRFYWMKNPR